MQHAQEHMQALFVHGMGRTPFSGWPMLRRLRAASIKTDSFGYLPALQEFEQISTRLASRVSELARRGDYVLIGHSLGGVLLRSALASLPAETRQPTRVFLLGSPIRPARLARLLQHNPLYQLLTGDCGQLLASDARMDSIAPVSAPSTGIFGVRGIRPTRQFFGVEANDGVVSVSEARADWMSETIDASVMHSFLPGNQRVTEHILARIDGCLKAACDDLADRRPVWDALSDMFLDTDVSLSREWRVRVLAESPYSVDDLERILVDEVYPVCKYNLLCVAGEWAGFDLDWLEEQILRRLASRWRFLRATSIARLGSGLPSEWRLMKTAIATARTTAGRTI